MSSNNSNGHTGQKSKRYQAELPVNPKTVSALIGRGGSGMKRLVREVGGGLFIRAYKESEGQKTSVRLSECDRIHIEAYSAEAVKQAAQLLKTDEKAILSGSAPTRPQQLVKCDGHDSKAVGTVIGQGGKSIRRIMETAGNGCYIVHKRELGGFQVTADTATAVAHAVSKIQDAIRDYHGEQKQWAKRRRFGNQSQDTSSKKSSNGFSALDSSDDSGSSDSEGEDEATKSKQEYQSKVGGSLINSGLSRLAARKAKQDSQNRMVKSVSKAISQGYSHGGIRDRKRGQQDRYEVRKQMAKWTDSKTGDKRFKDYEFFTKAGKKIVCRGEGAVPWPEVDKEMALRQKTDAQDLEQARGLAAQARQQKSRRNLVDEMKSEDSFPGLPAKSSRVQVEETAKSSKVLQQCPALLEAMADLASEKAKQKPKSMWGSGTSRHLKVDEAGEEELSRQKRARKVAAARPKMASLGGDRSHEDLGGVESTSVDLGDLTKPVPNQRNVSLCVLPAPAKVKQVLLKPKVKASWADMADEDDSADDEAFYAEDDGLVGGAGAVDDSTGW